MIKSLADINRFNHARPDVRVQTRDEANLVAELRADMSAYLSEEEREPEHDKQNLRALKTKLDKFFAEEEAEPQHEK